MNPLLLNPWVLAGIVAAIVMIGGGGYIKGRTAQAVKTAQCEAKLGQVKEVQNELAKKAAEQRLVSERITKDVSNSWSAALDYARSHPRIVRVQQPANCAGGGLRAVPNAATGINAAPAKPRPSSAEDALNEKLDQVEIAYKDVEERLNNAVLDAAQLAKLQEWVRQQRGVR